MTPATKKLIELFDAAKRERRRPVPRWESVAGLIRYAVRMILRTKR